MVMSLCLILPNEREKWDDLLRILALNLRSGDMGGDGTQRHTCASPCRHHLRVLVDRRP